MGTLLTVYKQEFSKDENGRNQIIFTEIGGTQNSELIEELRDVGLSSWYLDSECGCIFELTGEQLLPYLKRLHADKKDIFEEEFYRLDISY